MACDRPAVVGEETPVGVDGDVEGSSHLYPWSANSNARVYEISKLRWLASNAPRPMTLLIS
jgi:hypothetical protein